MARRRGGGTLLPLALALLVAIVVVVALLAPAVQTARNIATLLREIPRGIPLAVEVEEPTVLAAWTLELQPGQVYEVRATAEGLALVQRSSRLVDEAMRLENITLAVGDVIAPHLYDWYFDGRDDEVIYDVPSYYFGAPHPEYRRYTEATWIVRFKLKQLPQTSQYYKVLGGKYGYTSACLEGGENG